MTYLFETTATMKLYNSKKWWIDANIVRDITIDADNVEDAATQYADIVKEKFYIDISANALKNKNPMYVDTKDGQTKQVGFVITGKAEFQDETRYKWVTQYIDLWVHVSVICDAFPGEV